MLGACGAIAAGECRMAVGSASGALPPRPHWSPFSVPSASGSSCSFRGASAPASLQRTGRRLAGNRPDLIRNLGLVFALLRHQSRDVGDGCREKLGRAIADGRFQSGRPRADDRERAGIRSRLGVCAMSGTAVGITFDPDRCGGRPCIRHCGSEPRTTWTCRKTGCCLTRSRKSGRTRSVRTSRPPSGL